MFVRARDIGFERRIFEGEDPAAILELGGREEDRVVRPAGPVRYRLAIYEAGGEIVVAGAVRMQVEFRCSRCDRYFGATVEEPSVLEVLDVPQKDEFVDLTDRLREAILLRFPSHPVCREDCPGLCPLCGAHRGETACQCRPPSDGRWSALDGLRPFTGAEL